MAQVVTPLVTVITPAYNRADLLAETIDSVLGQDYPRVEYLVLDDGSSDGTLAVMQRYGERLRAYSHANMGEARTVNRGFELATGELVVVVNSDDPLLPGALSALVAALVAAPRAVVAYPDWQVIDEQGRVQQQMPTRESPGLVRMVRDHLCLPGPAALFRRSVVERMGGRDPELRYVSDLEFWFRAALLGDFVRVPRILATFRVHGGSASVASMGERMAAEHLTVLDKLFARADLPPELRAVEGEARSVASYFAGLNCGGALGRRKLGYFAQALRQAPQCYLGLDGGVRLAMMAASLAGVSAMDASIWWLRLRRALGRR